MNIFFCFLLWIVAGCHNTDKVKKVNPTSLNENITDSQIHITYKNFNPGSWSYSYFDGLQQQTKIICPPQKKIDIFWDKSYTFSLKTMPYQGYYPIDQGDSIVITKSDEIGHSKVEISNSRFNEFEINFTGFLSKNDCSILEFFFRKIMKDNRVPVFGSAKDNYERSLFLLDSCLKQNLIRGEYSDWLKPILKFSYFEALLSLNEPIPALSANELIDSIELNKYSYRSFLQNYFIKRELKTDWGKIDFRTAYNYVNTKYTGPVKDYLLFFCLTNILEKYPKEKNVFLSKFNVDCKTEKYLFFIKNNYQIGGSSKENFANSILNQNGGIEKLDSVIKSHKGSLIYIDFWASWCVPCRAEMPNSIALREKFKNVVFLYLSIDEKKQDWIKAISEVGLKNYDKNYLVLNPKESNLIKDLKITAIPRYVILNSKGEIIDKDALSPSNAALPALLKKLAESIE